MHFGTVNDSAKDCYYIQVGRCTAAALGVGNSAVSTLKTVYFSPDEKELIATTGWLTLDGKPYTPVSREHPVSPVYTDGTIDTQVGDGSLLTLAQRMNPFAEVLIDAYYSTAYGWDHPGAGETLGPLTRYTVQYQGKTLPAWFDGADTASGFFVRDTVYEDADGNRNGPNDIVAKQVEGGPPVYSYACTVSTLEAAQRALVGLNAAIVSKDKIRAHLGALQNRLENTISNLATQAENLQAAESRISDVDVATEMTQFVRNQILTQSAVAILSQANSLPQMALQLMG